MMERKTILAIFASLAVLFLYQSIFVPPKRPQTAVNSEVIESKQVKKITDVILQQTSKKPIHSTDPEIVAENYDIKTPSLNMQVSNVGGSLHNVGVGHHPVFPLDDILVIPGFESVEFKPRVDGKSYAYENDNWRIVKTVESIDENAFKVKIEFFPSRMMSRLENLEFVLFGINSNMIDPSNKRETMLDEYSVNSNDKIVRKGNAFKFEQKEAKSQDGTVKWAGFRDHYNAFVVRPEFQTKGHAIKVVSDKELQVSVVPQEHRVAQGEPQSFEFTVYAGPQSVSLMKTYEKEFEKIVAFSGFWLINGIAMAIYYTIPFLHNIFKSWGLCIILIALLVYALSYPLTIKSMASMRKMQLISPKIKAIQDRNKGDPKKAQAEILEVYRREKINPMGGCLPLILQMPLFMALYQVIWRAHYFNGEGFLWVRDLTLPDRLFILPFSLPFLGNEFNILPILMAIVMAAQQFLSAKSMVITDEQQALQQKMMMYIFPGFIGFIFYKFAAGLSLYFTVFYLLSTLTQWKMMKVK